MRQILCLRGDRPSGGGQRLVYAKNLVERLRLRLRYQDHFELSLAAYPEIHPDPASADADIQHFVAKVRAEASSATNQCFYNCDASAFSLDRCAAAGLTVHVTVGITPITNIESLQRFSAKVSADIPSWLEKSMWGYAEDEKSLIAFGVDVVTELCEKLLQMSAPALHFFTLNRWGAASQICRNLGFREI